jgi:hypothetical protein
VPSRKTILAFGLACGVCAWAAAPAAATISLTPNQHDFGAQQVGTASAPFTFTLRVTCYPDFANPPNGCSSPHPFTPSISVTGPFTVQNNTCTSTMPGDSTPFGTTCTFGISFAPTLSGSQTGIVSSGDPDGFGKAAVQGIGTAVPPLATGAAKKKKCKKKKRAAAAKKKCKKRK